jgi:hypothetical protein
MNLSRSLNIISFILLLLFCALMLQLSLPYLTLRYDVGFLLTKQNIIHIKPWRYSFYIHVGLSIFAFAAGLTQFSSYILKKYRKFHRTMGYVYVMDILVFAGPSGLLMSFYANGTAAAKTSFVLLSMLWILFTAVALKKVKEKNFTAHKNWMIRSYALTLSAVSLRLYAMFLPKIIHLNAFDEYTLIAWLSWTLNLIIAEIIIFRKRSSVVLLR